MTSTWHVGEALLRDYADGAVADATAFSIEAHMVACATCRAAAAPHVEVARLDAVWGEVVDVVDAPRPGVVESLLPRLGLSPSTARLLGVTPALRAPWLLAVSVVLAVAVVAGPGHTGQRSDMLLLLLAPLIPVAGTAAVFHSGMDAAEDLASAAPASSFWLVMVRTASVLVTSVALAGLASLLAPHLGWLVFAWLMPALALTMTTLALATWLRPVVAAGAVATVWLVGIVGNEVVAAGGLAGLRADGPIRAVAFHPAGQIALAGVAVAAAVLTICRRDSFDVEMEVSW